MLNQQVIQPMEVIEFEDLGTRLVCDKDGTVLYFGFDGPRVVNNLTELDETLLLTFEDGSFELLWG